MNNERSEEYVNNSKNLFNTITKSHALATKNRKGLEETITLVQNEFYEIFLLNGKETEEKYLQQTYHLLQKYTYHLRDVLFQGIHGQMKGGEYDETG